MVNVTSGNLSGQHVYFVSVRLAFALTNNQAEFEEYLSKRKNDVKSCILNLIEFSEPLLLLFRKGLNISQWLYKKYT